MLSRILSWSSETGLPSWLAEDKMPPLSSTKHVHGTEVVALKGGNGVFPPPLHWGVPPSEHTSYISGCLFTAWILHLHSSALTLGSELRTRALAAQNWCGWATMGQRRGCPWLAPRCHGDWHSRDRQKWAPEANPTDEKIDCSCLACTECREKGSSAVLETLSPITCNSGKNLGHTWMEAD